MKDVRLIYSMLCIILFSIFSCAGLYTWSQLEKGDDPNSAVIIRTYEGIYIQIVDGKILCNDPCIGYRTVKLKPGEHNIGVVYSAVESPAKVTGKLKYFQFDSNASDSFLIMKTDLLNKYKWDPYMQNSKTGNSILPN